MMAVMLLATASGAFVPPTMGWASWNAYRVNISDEVICREADAMVRTGLKYAGYDHINIDDGFFGGRDADGTLLVHPVRFPRGLKPVCSLTPIPPVRQRNCSTCSSRGSHTFVLCRSHTPSLSHT